MSFSRTVDTATIPASGTTSDARTTPSKKTLVAVEMPAAFTGTSLSFEVSNDGGATWRTAADGSTAYSITVAANQYHSLKPEVFYGAGLVRVKSNAAEAAERQLNLIFID